MPLSASRQAGRLPCRAVVDQPDTSQVYVAPDGRPAIRLREKNMGSDGDGVLFVVEKGGIAVPWWAPNDEVPSDRWQPVLPADAAERLAELEGKANRDALERDALLSALRTACNLLPDDQAAQVREAYRRLRPS